jgi:hypothetical protein
MKALGAERRSPTRTIAIQSSNPLTEIDMPLIAALLFLLVLSPSIALAQEIPEYDSEAHCKRVAESAAKPSATLGRCLWMEEYALDELETFWSRANKAIREECLEIASEKESYVVLARCVMARVRRSR